MYYLFSRSFVAYVRYINCYDVSLLMFITCSNPIK